jgi:glycosyltransferase involved in cell wall biosynthesis
MSLGFTDESFAPLEAQARGIALPAVAVVIGSYNQARYVESAIRSVAVQTYRNLECVIVDDHSTDGSAEAIAAVLRQLGDKRFRSVVHQVNGGQAATMQSGLAATAAPFVAFLDADDLWHPNFIEEHLRAHLSEFGIAAVSVSNMAVVSSEGVQLSGGKPNFISAHPESTRRKARFREDKSHGVARYFMERGIPRGWMWSATSGLMFRRAVLDLLCPADTERLRICTDGYLARGAHMLGGTVRIDKALGGYRLHPDNNFSRNPLLGDQAELGRTPRAISHAIQDELTARLLEHADELQMTIPPRYLAELLLYTAGYDRASQLWRTDARAKRILRHAPKGRWLKAFLKNLEHMVGKTLRR